MAANNNNNNNNIVHQVAWFIPNRTGWLTDQPTETYSKANSIRNFYFFNAKDKTVEFSFFVETISNTGEIKTKNASVRKVKVSSGETVAVPLRFSNYCKEDISQLRCWCDYDGDSRVFSFDILSEDNLACDLVLKNSFGVLETVTIQSYKSSHSFKTQEVNKFQIKNEDKRIYTATSFMLNKEEAEWFASIGNITTGYFVSEKGRFKIDILEKSVKISNNPTENVEIKFKIKSKIY